VLCVLVQFCEHTVYSGLLFRKAVGREAGELVCFYINVAGFDDCESSSFSHMQEAGLSTE